MSKNYKITLEAARVNAGLTQEQAAERLGVTPRTIINWEKGLTSPKTRQLAQISDLYNWPITLINF